MHDCAFKFTRKYLQRLAKLLSKLTQYFADNTGQHKISFWDESSYPLLILGRGIRKLVLKLSVSSSFRDMGTSNIC